MLLLMTAHVLNAYHVRSGIEGISEELQLLHCCHFLGQFQDTQQLAFVERPQVQEARLAPAHQ